LKGFLSPRSPDFNILHPGVNSSGLNSPRLATQETLKTFMGSEIGNGLVECKDADDMFRKLGI
jgi:hypothetical protein